MINHMQKAIIKKDLRSVTSNKQMFSVMLIVPLALTVVLPSIFILVVHFVPDDWGDFQKMLDLLPAQQQQGGVENTLIMLLLNNIIPLFFLMVPIMAASVMAASSFVGEKEKSTLETLLYAPIRLKGIFQSKVLASFLMSMLVSLTSFITMLLVVETELLLLTGSMILPGVNWFIIMLLISPALSMVAITLIVRGSAKAQTVEEAQQRSVLLILPILMLVLGQFMGVILISVWVLLALGAAMALLALLLMKNSLNKFTYETLLL